MEISRSQYDYALNRIEKLLPFVTETPSGDKNAIELAIVSDIVKAYEQTRHPMACDLSCD